MTQATITCTNDELRAMSLKSIAELVNIPSIVKMSKDKAVARASIEIMMINAKAAEYVAKAEKQVARSSADAKAAIAKAKAKAKAAVDKPAKVAKAPRVSKFDLLRNALTTPHTFDELVAILETTPVSLRTMLSDIKNPKYSRGPAVNVIKTGDTYQAA